MLNDDAEYKLWLCSTQTIIYIQYYASFTDSVTSDSSFICLICSKLWNDRSTMSSRLAKWNRIALRDCGMAASRTTAKRLRATGGHLGGGKVTIFVCSAREMSHWLCAIFEERTEGWVSSLDGDWHCLHRVRANRLIYGAWSSSKSPLLMPNHLDRKRKQINAWVANSS